MSDIGAFPGATGGDGMSLRDYFAAKAMQGLMSTIKRTESFDYDAVAKISYDQADAMLKARHTSN